MNITFISRGDLIDLYYKLKQKGFKVLSPLLHLTNQARTVSKWNKTKLVYSSSLFIEPAKLIDISISRFGDVNVKKTSLGSVHIPQTCAQ